MGLIFIIMQFIAWPWWTALFSIAAVTSLFFNKSFKGHDFYLAELAAFFIPGLGIAYLGHLNVGLAIYVLHIILLFTMGIIGSFFEIKSTVIVGAMFMVPFFIQLFITGLYYKRDHGDIEKIWKRLPPRGLTTPKS